MVAIGQCVYLRLLMLSLVQLWEIIFRNFLAKSRTGFGEKMRWIFITLNKMMMKHPVVTVLFFFLSLTSVLGQKIFFVATNGNDKNTGSIEKPLATLSRAVDLLKKTASNKVDIVLREGIYYPDTAIVLNAENINGKTIRISSYKSEKVVISGARKINLNWKKHNHNIYSGKVALNFNPDAMFVNGKPTIMARYPNYDATARFFNGAAADAISKERVKKWANPIGGYFHALHAGEWGSFHYRITEKDNDGNLKMDGGWQNNRPSPLHNSDRFVENVFEELDAPNEWYYDKNAGIIYFYPNNVNDLETAVVEVSHLQNLISIKGKENLPIKNISISNINFIQTQRTLFEPHEALLRSDWKLHRGGALLLENTENIQIDNCVFTNLGSHAIMVSGYNKKMVISNNHIYNIGQSGICFVGDVSAVRNPLFSYEALPYKELDLTAGPKNNKFPENCLVENNLIHNIGQVEKQATAVEIAMSESITVKNNTIYNTPRAGINIGDGTWGGHMIENNDVFNTVLETGDHGAFNSWGRDRFWNANRKYMDSITTIHPELILLDAHKTTTIRNNRFRCDHGWDIDLDDGSSNYHIYNNICLNGGIKLREGFFRTVENNIMINNSFHPHVWFAKSEDVFRRNIVTRNYYPIIIPHWGKEVDFNYFSDSVSLAKAKESGTDKNSLYGDPMFLNANRGDYSLQKNSPARTIGFKDIDLNNIGVQNPKLIAKALKVTIPTLILPQGSVAKNDNQTEWLDVVIRNVNGLGDRSAYGLTSENGVVVTSTKGSHLVKSGLLPKDVILGSENTVIKDIFDLLNEYQKINWTGKMNLDIVRDQQPKKITIQLK